MARQMAQSQRIEFLSHTQEGPDIRERIQNSKPILPVINLQPLKGSQSVIGFDEALSNMSSLDAHIGPAGLHPIGTRQGTHHHLSHTSLQGLELGGLGGGRHFSLKLKIKVLLRMGGRVYPRAT